MHLHQRSTNNRGNGVEYKANECPRSEMPSSQERSVYGLKIVFYPGAEDKGSKMGRKKGIAFIEFMNIIDIDIDIDIIIIENQLQM